MGVVHGVANKKRSWTKQSSSAKLTGSKNPSREARSRTETRGSYPVDRVNSSNSLPALIALCGGGGKGALVKGIQGWQAERKARYSSAYECRPYMLTWETKIRLSHGSTLLIRNAITICW